MIGKLANSTAAPIVGESFREQVKTYGGKFVLVAAQLALVLFAIRVYQVENGFGFQQLLPLIFGGFVVHAWLPEHWRQPFFVSLTLAGIWLLFGPVGGSWLIGIGLLLIALAHLPAPMWIRVTLVVAVGAVLTAFRAGWMQTEWSGGIIAILGSMFMFRMALYLYDMRSEKKPATLFERLSYFFQLPNIVFPFYPIVDYITFRRTYYDRDAYEIYQKGVLWMLRGVIHLLLYRVVYYYFTPAVEEVQGLGGVVLFMVSAYLLYLRVSGLFHLIVGLMCLFGFNLPETHKRYFLASSFNDYWRRINIYWKDFMMKLFFYPVYMRVRSWGNIPALVFSTVVVFACTWILHSYQWFWLQGDFPLTTVDGVYWGVLGVLVAVNSVWESVKGKKAKSLSKKGWTLRGSLGLSLRTVLTFLFLGVMWSFWSSESVGEWWSVMKQVSASGAPEWLLLAGGLAGLYVVLVGLDVLEAKGWSPFFEERGMQFSTVASRTGLMALALAGVGLPQVHERAGEQASEFIASLQGSRLNARDQAQIERGYYENLLANDSYTSGLFGAQTAQQEEGWEEIYDTEAVEHREDILLWSLRPGVDMQFKHAKLTTNQWGMRDKDYTKEKADSTFRMALLGASYVMGAGVADGETFESIVEKRLNEAPASDSVAAYEILNFSVGGYGLAQQVAVLEDGLFDFSPDAILYVVQPEEVRRTIERLLPAVLEDKEISVDYIRQILDELGVTAQTSRPEARRLLFTRGEEMVERGYARIAELSRANGAVPVLVCLPNTRRPFEEDEFVFLQGLAERLGMRLVDLRDAYAGRDVKELVVAPWDAHPNSVGHKMIANAFFTAIARQPDLYVTTIVQASADQP